MITFTPGRLAMNALLWLAKKVAASTGNSLSLVFWHVVLVAHSAVWLRLSAAFDSPPTMG